MNCTFCGVSDSKEHCICFSHVRLRIPTGDFLECAMCAMCSEYNYCVKRYVCDSCVDEFRDGLCMKSKFRCRICVMRNETHPDYMCKSVCGDCYAKFEERNRMLGRTLPKSVPRQDRRCSICRNKNVEYYMESCSVHV